jgi:hypothetical protein
MEEFGAWLVSAKCKLVQVEVQTICITKPELGWL